MLGLFEVDGATEEGGGKQNIIHTYSAQCLKIIFILLTKMVEVYVKSFGIDLQGPGLK